jgi:hypothetical protein
VGADYCCQEPATGASGEDIELFEPDHRDELLLKTDEGTYERSSSRPHRTDVEPLDCEGLRCGVSGLTSL